MDINEFLRILKKADGQLQKEERKGLQEILRKYPYFQAAYALRLKSLHREKHPDYPAELSKAASHTSDREVLYDLINEEPFVQNTIAHSLERTHTVAHEAWRQAGGAGLEEELQEEGPYAAKEHYPLRTEDPNLFVPVDRQGESSEAEEQDIYEGGGSREAGFTIPEGEIPANPPESAITDRNEDGYSEEIQDTGLHPEMESPETEIAGEDPEGTRARVDESRLPEPDEWEGSAGEVDNLRDAEVPPSQDTPSAPDDSSLWGQIDAGTAEEDMEAELLSGIPLNLDEATQQDDEPVPDEPTGESLQDSFFEEDKLKPRETPDYWEGGTHDWTGENSKQDGDSGETEPWMNEIIDPLDTDPPVEHSNPEETDIPEDEALVSKETGEPESYDPERESESSRLLGENLKEAFVPGAGDSEEHLEDSYSQILGIENERTRNIELSPDTGEYEPSVAERATDRPPVQEAATPATTPKEPGRLSFLDWISRTDEKANESEPAIPGDPEKARKFELVDRFIESNPRIDVSPATDENAQNTETPGSAQDSTLFTETLAQLYREQGNYEKALNAYRALQLKYPEKSSYFAALIEEVNALQRNK